MQIRRFVAGFPALLPALREFTRNESRVITVTLDSTKAIFASIIQTHVQRNRRVIYLCVNVGRWTRDVARMKLNRSPGRL